jgi:hypothetical protein
VKRSTRTQPTPKPTDAGSTRETDTATLRDDDGDPKAEARTLDEAWRSIIDTRDDDSLADRPLGSLMFAALEGGPYEGAEGDAPVVAVLRAIRATVEGWARAHSGSTLFAFVAFADLHLMTRRLDVAIQIVRCSPGGVR